MSDSATGFLVLGITAVVAFLAAGLLVYLFKRPTKMQREHLAHQASALGGMAPRPQIVTQPAVDEVVRTPKYSLRDVPEFLSTGSTLPPEFSPAWRNVLGGGVFEDFDPITRAEFFQFRSWQFGVIETCNVIKRRRGTGRDNVHRHKRYTTHLLALLPSTVPTTALWPEHNRPLGEGDKATGMVLAPTGSTAFDQLWTVVTADPQFARAAFGPPFQEQLLIANQQGTCSRLLFKRDVVHIGTEGPITDCDYHPFAVYLAHLLQYVNPQVWQGRLGAPAPAETPDAWGSPGPQTPPVPG